MPDDVTIDLGGYVSSKRASETTGYTQDYIGQLARGAQIDARRIGGLWYVSMESLNAYKAKADDFKPNPPVYDAGTHDTESIVTFEGKEYISANRASKITGYNQDYIGQLARSGKVMSRQVGNRWYVDRSALVAHQEEKNALLAAVQAQSVGITNGAHTPAVPQNSPKEADSLLLYTKDAGDLLPATKDAVGDDEYFLERQTSLHQHTVPIRVINDPEKAPIYQTITPLINTRKNNEIKSVSVHAKTIYRGMYPAMTLTIIVILSVGIVSFKQNSIYTMFTTSSSVANATIAFESVMAGLEKALTTELVYQKTN